MVFLKGIRFFIALTVLCIIGVLLTSYPGEITISWFSYTVTLPIGLFLGCLTIVFGIFLFFYNTWKWLWSIPHNYISYLRNRRNIKGNNLLIDGLSAIAAGQNHEAKEVISVACELLPDNPLTHFIAAQACYMTGDEEAATKHYSSLLKDKRTSFLGLRGLITQSKNREQYKFAQEYINKAISIRPDSPWLQEEYLQNTIKLAQKGIFPKIEKEKITKYLAKSKWQRHQAMLYWLRLQNTSHIAGAEKEKVHLKIFDYAPDWTENVQQLVEYYLSNESYSKAQKLLMDAFKAHPHRALGVLWDLVFQDMQPIDRYRTMEKLVLKKEEHPESQFCLATSAIKAQLWGQAKGHLDNLLSHGYSRTACNLMAELMELQHPTQFELAREWWQRASQTASDYEWQCNSCHSSSEKWHLVCENCQSIDQIYWQETSFAQRQVRGHLEAARIG